MDVREFLVGLAYAAGVFMVGFIANLTWHSVRNEQQGKIRAPAPLWVSVVFAVAFAFLGLSAMVATIIQLSEKVPFTTGFVLVLALRFGGFMLANVALVYMAMHKATMVIDPNNIGQVYEKIKKQEERKRHEQG